MFIQQVNSGSLGYQILGDLKSLLLIM